jgi:uncharacterized protein with GYD domain
MPKYLIEATYTAEGLRGLTKDKASGRRKAIEKGLTAIGGKLESIHFAFGDADVILICDCPDAASAAGFAIVAGASGSVKTKTTALLTIEEIDSGLSKNIKYQAPGT